ncbi:MAG: hypothetical protein R3Y54_10890 [Eubacteriales bacterium]
MGLHVSEPVDVVAIGSSVMLMSYAPLLAWEQEGIVTYNNSWHALTAESILYATKEVYKHQSPEVLVIDLKPFQYGDGLPGSEEAAIRNFSDSIPYSWNRLDFILDVVPDRVDEAGNKNPLNYIFDIAKYHSRWTLIGASAVRSWNNSTRSIAKGFNYNTNIGTTNGFLDHSMVTTEHVPTEYMVGVFEDFLAYCKTLDSEILFVVTPYSEPLEHREYYNYYERRILEYGYNYMHMNDYQDEININYDTDFYDGGHLNLDGAMKYTAFFSSYLKETYDLINRKDDPIYRQWHEDYSIWIAEIRTINNN